MKSLNIVKRNYALFYLQDWKYDLDKCKGDKTIIKQRVNYFLKLVAHYEAIEKELDTLHLQDPNNNLLILYFSEYSAYKCLWDTQRIACHSTREAIETYTTLSAEAHKRCHYTSGTIELRSPEEERHIKELQNQITRLKAELDNLMEEFSTLTREGEDNEY